MADRPILFSGPMVRAILEGRKTQTRRVVKPQPVRSPMKCHYVKSGWSTESVTNEHGVAGCDCRSGEIRCPYGVTGDMLWVRETWCYESHPTTSKPTGRVFYRATDDVEFEDDGDGFPKENRDGTFRSPWKPSIHMPRRASRITLEVVGVRVERLQDISENDAQAEGVNGPMVDRELDAIVNQIGLLPSQAFAALWDSINAERAPWSSNPWVWVVEFKKQEASRG